jgi:hypothetical protein
VTDKAGSFDSDKDIDTDMNIDTDVRYDEDCCFGLCKMGAKFMFGQDFAVEVHVD